MASQTEKDQTEASYDIALAVTAPWEAIPSETALAVIWALDRAGYRVIKKERT